MHGSVTQGHCPYLRSFSLSTSMYCTAFSLTLVSAKQKPQVDAKIEQNPELLKHQQILVKRLIITTSYVWKTLESIGVAAWSDTGGPRVSAGIRARARPPPLPCASEGGSPRGRHGPPCALFLSPFPLGSQALGCGVWEENRSEGQLLSYG